MSSAAARPSSPRSPARSTGRFSASASSATGRNPGIVVTVDLMSTGVDIPDLEFIVFLRPVKSRILFEQMLGRGTRKGEQYPDKSHFVVFDCFDGTLLEYFRTATGMTVEPPRRRARTIAADHRGHLAEPRPRLQHPSSRQAPAAHRQGDVRRGARTVLPLHPGRRRRPLRGRSAAPDAASRSTLTMSILRDPDFQRLLHRLPARHAHPSWSRPRVTDTVDSEWLIQAGVGKEYKPDDYLQAFAAFVASARDGHPGAPDPARPAGRLEPGGAQGTAQKRCWSRPSTSPRPTCGAPSRSRSTRLW